MRKKLFVLVVLIDVATSIQCYSWRSGAKSEFTDHVPKCHTDFACITATYKELFYTDCAIDDDCSDRNLEYMPRYRRFLNVAANRGGVTLVEQDIKIDCCKEDLCNEPTAKPAPFGNQCYVYTGKRSNMRESSTRTCQHGTHCVTAVARDFVIVTRCVLECSEFNRKTVEFEASRALSRIIGPVLPEVADYEVKSECCTGHLCNGAYMNNGGKGSTTNGTNYDLRLFLLSGNDGRRKTTGKEATTRRTNAAKRTDGAGDFEVFHAWSESESDDATSKENTKRSLSSLLSFTLALLFIVYSMH